MVLDLLERLAQRQDLSRAEARSLVGAIMQGAVGDVQAGALLTALRVKGETPEEITGAVEAMRERAIRITPRREGLVDTCGTGGDRKGTFNISTIAAFVVAGAGVPVAKHGNRAASSRCGSADLMKELGVNVEAEPATVERCIEEVGIGFLYAPVFHQAMRRVAGARQALGIRTLFNILGPLTNPAGARRQLLGVFSPFLTVPLAQVLRNLGSERSLLVHGLDGMDEITITGRTRATELRDERIRTFYIDPARHGLPTGRAEDLSGGGPAENALLARRILQGEERGARRDVVLLNAAAALGVAGRASTVQEGLAVARDALDSGSALRTLQSLVDCSHSR